MYLVGRLMHHLREALVLELSNPKRVSPLTMMKMPAHLAWQRLFDDTIVCIACSDHPEVKDGKSEEDFLDNLIDATSKLKELCNQAHDLEQILFHNFNLISSGE